MELSDRVCALKLAFKWMMAATVAVTIGASVGLVLLDWLS